MPYAAGLVELGPSPEPRVRGTGLSGSSVFPWNTCDLSYPLSSPGSLCWTKTPVTPASNTKSRCKGG